MQTSKTRRKTLKKSCLALAISQFLMTPVEAATISVISASDSPGSLACSLRDAIAVINNQAAVGNCLNNGNISGVLGTDDTININLVGATNTLLLEQGFLSILQPMTINGPGQDQLTIDAGGNSGVISIFSDNVSLSGVTVTGGMSAGSGAGIRMDGDNIRISDCTITDNTSTNSGTGGGISNIGNNTISECIITGNQAYRGGGLAFNGIDTVSARIENSIISNNRSANSGGGILFNQISGAVLIESRVTENSNQASNGGGIYALSSSGIQIYNTSISENTATQDGGGVLLRGQRSSLGATNSIIASTLYGNTAIRNGGGFSGYSGSKTQIVNSTISGNLGILNAGAASVFDSGTELNLFNSTIFDNRTDSISDDAIAGISSDDATVNSRNTVIANLSGADCNSALFANPDDNWIADGSCTNESPGDGDPGLGPLQNNGGSTLTHLPLRGSGLFDQGSGFVCMNPPVNSTDQRGEARGARRSAACFIGSVEGSEEGSIFVVPTENGSTVIFEL